MAPGCDMLFEDCMAPEAAPMPPRLMNPSLGWPARLVKPI